LLASPQDSLSSSAAERHSTRPFLTRGGYQSDARREKSSIKPPLSATVTYGSPGSNKFLDYNEIPGRKGQNPNKDYENIRPRRCNKTVLGFESVSINLGNQIEKFLKLELISCDGIIEEARERVAERPVGLSRPAFACTTNVLTSWKPNLSPQTSENHARRSFLFC
jgi:hypothetical protein